MQTSTFLSWRNRSRGNHEGLSYLPHEEGFIERHHVGEIVQGLVMSSVMWCLLAVGIYAVYSLVLGA